ncbi:MAG: hypothetical protein AWT59_2209 [Candidatus Gallionella acididurans]|uniref:Uncharacterized protein n=1 Tax=Candidatus Gallionella acididurans TaxID=1796491 RepID=A0A139BRL6_9PROT|nr:MAG: hypothetical protein AWT59_2209 [Candidatus Gallionella acididurans]
MDEGDTQLTLFKANTTTTITKIKTQIQPAIPLRVVGVLVEVVQAQAGARESGQKRVFVVSWGNAET